MRGVVTPADRMAALLRKLDAKAPRTRRSAPLKTSAQLEAALAPYLTTDTVTVDEVLLRIAAARVRGLVSREAKMAKECATLDLLETLHALLRPYLAHDPSMPLTDALALLARSRCTLH